MPTVSIEKVENGYILAFNGKRYVKTEFAEVVINLATVFNESEFIPPGIRRKNTQQSSEPVKARKPGRPRKTAINQKGNKND